METEHMDLSPMDFLMAIFSGKEVLSIAENREALTVVVTAVALLVGFGFFLIWRRSGTEKKDVGPPRPTAIKVPPPPEIEADDGSKKVTVFFGTQTGTAEGFAKVWIGCGLILTLHQY
jgi:NADPH-ferrihemoprotein reductase